jgi:hypothetical protein
MDYSKISTADLQELQKATQNGDYSKVSTPGLQEYHNQMQHESQAQVQAQNPQNQTVPDAAQKASQPPAQQYLSPGESATNNYWTNVKARITDPSRWEATAINQGPAKKDVTDGLGAAGLSLPAEAAPGAIQSLASYLGGSGVGPAAARIGANTALGAGTGAYGDEKDRAGGAKVGGAIGAAGGVLGEAVGGVANAVKWGGRQLARMTAPQGEAYLGDPSGTGEMAKALEDPSKMPALQDQAADAIKTSRGVLRGQGMQSASTLKQTLDGKTVTVNPNDYLGLDPRGDELLNSAMNKPTDAIGSFQRTAQGIPDQVSMDANDANQLKRYLQEGAQFAQGTVTDPVQAAKVGQLAQKASALRSSIEQVAPEAADLNKSMQDGMMLQKALRSGGKTSPLAFVSSESPDRVATLARAENSGAGGLLDFGNKLGAAKTMTKPDVGSGVPTFLTKMGGRGLMQGAQAVGDATDATPVGIQALLQGLFSGQNKTQ